jgi:hypothetical protein
MFNQFTTWDGMNMASLWQIYELEEGLKQKEDEEV